MASYAYVFMVAGLIKKVKQPVAYYFSVADRLSVLLKEVWAYKWYQHTLTLNFEIVYVILTKCNKLNLAYLARDLEWMIFII